MAKSQSHFQTKLVQLHAVPSPRGGGALEGCTQKAYLFLKRQFINKKWKKGIWY